jgi:hypothetical protein
VLEVGVACVKVLRLLEGAAQPVPWLCLSLTWERVGRLCSSPSQGQSQGEDLGAMS